MATSEAFLLRDRLDSFMHWLNDNSIPWRSGSGDYQMVQIYIKKSWNVLYIGGKYQKYYKGIDNLAELIKEFNKAYNKLPPK